MNKQNSNRCINTENRQVVTIGEGEGVSEISEWGEISENILYPDLYLSVKDSQAVHEDLCILLNVP